MDAGGTPYGRQENMAGDAQTLRNRLARAFPKTPEIMQAHPFRRHKVAGKPGHSGKRHAVRTRFARHAAPVGRQDDTR